MTSRRRFLAGLAAGLLPWSAARAQYRLPLDTQRFDFVAEPVPGEAQAKIEAILRGRVPNTDRIALEAPDIAENGNAVAITVRVACAMTADDHPRVVHLLAPENPYTEVARYYFTPAGGRAEFTSRCRMRATGPLVAIAEMSDGSAAMTERLVNVTVGACS